MSKQKDNKEKIDKLLRSEMITIGLDVDDAKTGQMWAYDSERLSKRIIVLFEPLIEGATQLAFENGYAEGQQHSIETDAKLVEEAKRKGEKKALRRILRESKYLSPYELMSSIKQALGGK